MEAILDLSKPLDIPLLDKVVDLFYRGAGSNEANQARKILEQFTEHPDSWTQVHFILQQSQNESTKFLALQILEKLIGVRWKTLDRTQQEGIRSFIINEIVSVSSTEQGLTQQRTYLRKLNRVLIDILKHEWPHNWPGFITEIINSSRSNLFLCENNMNILKLLSEEVFEYSAEQMTRNKTRNMQNQLTVEISQIFNLCYEILSKSDKQSLVYATLETLLGVLSWIPSGYILETDIVKILVTKYLEIPGFRNLTLKCLSEINNIEFTDPSQANLPELLMMVMKHISSVLDFNINLSNIYEDLSDEEQSLILNLTLYLTSFFTNFLKFVETDKYSELLHHCHNLLLNITLIDDKEIFKICIEYWTGLVTTLYNEIKDSLNHDGKLINLSHQGAVPPSFLTAFPLRMHQYKPILSQLRVNLIDRMPKPEEVLVVENEDGEVVRETTQETDALEIYNSTKGCLVILTHLDFEDTHQIMKDKLARQIDGSNWSWTNLNRLCWAIGSISGTTSESSEKQFIVGIIKDLLGLCDFKKGKDNKAIVASNIMYVVGQYPRFLKKHWKFLKTVVNKLFEFMHESHEGVQDMACDTLKHITTKCGRHFVNLQPDEDTPYIYEIIKHLPKITSDLGPTQICVVYECLGQMIYSDNGPVENEILVERLMQEPNEFWTSLVTQFTSDPSCLRASDRVKLFNYFLRVNLAVSTYSKHLFNGQMAFLYPNLLKLYTNCSSIITQAVQENPNYGHVTPVVRGVRSIKKDILKLITSYISTCRNQDEVAATMVPSLFDTVLYDYNNMVNGAKEVEVLRLLCTLTSRLNKRISPHMNTVFNNVFVCTMGMICTDFTDHLDIRLEFYTMIRNIVKHCFDYILTLNPDAFSQVYKSIVWASKHITHDISEIGLLTFSELIEQFQVCPENVRNDFFTMCLYTMLQDVVNLITDRDHKSGFATQCRIMAQILKVVNSNVITIPLFNPQTVNNPNMTNEVYFREMVTSTFDVNFPHIGRDNTTAFVQDLIVSIDDLATFKLKMMDFLIQIKEFGDTSDLLKQDLEDEKARKAQEAREAALKIPGMVKPANLPPGMDD